MSVIAQILDRAAGPATFANLVLGLSLGLLEPVTAASYTFPQVDDSWITRSLEASTVRIFRNDGAADHDGSGFLIDGQSGLIVSADHVIQSNRTVWVAFANSENRYRAHILKPDSIDTKVGAFDFAVLQLDQSPDGSNIVEYEGASVLEIQFDRIDTEHKHRVTGFGRRGKAPEQGEGIPQQREDCTYAIRATAIQGDSGSPVLTHEGLVDGLAVKGAESGASTTGMAETLVLPLACVRERILAFVPDADSAAILKILGSGNHLKLRNAFQPPANIRRSWCSNLRLAKALTGWIAEHRKNTRLPALVDKQYLDEVTRILNDRRLGSWLTVEFTQSNATSKRAAADFLQKFGDSLQDSGATSDAVKAYAQARELYVAYAASLLPETWSASAGATADGLEIAKAYKSAADTAIKFGNITKNEADFGAATSLAAAAAYHAPNGALKASSLAALGSASHAEGDLALAVSAYQQAVDQGAKAVWTKHELRKSTNQLIGTGTEVVKSVNVEYLGRQADSVFRRSIRPHIM